MSAVNFNVMIESGVLNVALEDSLFFLGESQTQIPERLNSFVQDDIRLTHLLNDTDRCCAWSKKDGQNVLLSS